jgi:hypothetical protein
MQKGVILGCGNRSNVGMDTVTLVLIQHVTYDSYLVQFSDYPREDPAPCAGFVRGRLNKLQPKCRL